MIDYFGVHDSQISMILSINSLGLCLTSFLVGPLSDSYGRRQILVLGLLVFLLGSFGCVIATSFESMLWWRFIQGLSASIPAIISGALIADRYSESKAGQLLGFLNSLISATMAGAPILGAWITKCFHWRLNFTIILALALITFLGVFLLIEESLPKEKRKPFFFKNFIQDHLKLFKNLTFICYTLIVNFPFTAIVVYIAYLSVIMMNYLGFSIEQFSYYQATTMGTFIIFSLLSVKMIPYYGLDGTKNIGTFLALGGALGIFIISYTIPQNVNSISLAMAFIAAGGAVMAGPYGMKALYLFPELKGTSMGVMIAFRQLLTAGLIAIVEYFFDGTIQPVAWVIFGYGLLTLLCYGLIQSQTSIGKVSNS